jgi:death-on-curing protein
MSYIHLTLEEILQLHFRIVEDFGGSHGVRDEGYLMSVVEAPQQETFRQEQYPTLHTKAAVYLRNIIGDHLFSDGVINKQHLPYVVFFWHVTTNL